MYNKKILLEALKNLEKTKAPIKKKDISFDPTGKGMLNPIYAGKPVVLPTDTLYNPTPYTIKATSDNGIQKFLNPFDETNVHFPGASSIKEEPLMKKGGSKKQSKSLSATNKLLKKNPLFKKKNYKSKTYDPSAMYFQDGGFIPYDYNPYVSAEAPMEDIPFVNPIITGNEPEDYQAFLDYSRTAPENRRPNQNYFYGDPDNYDHYGMWEALGKPKDFQQALEMNPDWEPDPYDKMYHGFSVNPETGVFLKSGKPGDTKEGDTTWMEIAGHYLSPRANESTPVFDPELQRFKYIPNPSFQKGGTKMSQEEFEKRKAAYKKMTGRDFEPPKSFKQSPQAREYYQNKYNQQPVIQSQPSETTQQSRGVNNANIQQELDNSTREEIEERNRQRIDDSRTSFEADNRSNAQRERDQFYANQLTDPDWKQQIVNAVQAPLFQAGNFWDYVSGGDDWEKAQQAYNLNQLNPYSQNKMFNFLNTGLSNTGNALMTGMEIADGYAIARALPGFGKNLKNFFPTKTPQQLPGSPNAISSVDDVKQAGFINMKGAFQKYPKGKLTKEELEAYMNSDFYKESLKRHREAKKAYGDMWDLDPLAKEYLRENFLTGNRTGINSVLYGGDNWSWPDYLMAGVIGGAMPSVAGLYGLALAPPAVRSKVMRSVGIQGVPGGLEAKDTTIDITNRNMDFARVNEIKDGTVIIGGEFIESSNNTVRKAKDWLRAEDTYSDKNYPSDKIESFYGVEDGKFKVGKAKDFKSETQLVPRRFGAKNISKAVLNGVEMRLLDNKGQPIYQNTPNTGKFILYSPSTEKAAFIYITNGKRGVEEVNKFLKENKDAQYIHLDNGRYEFYGVNEQGLTQQDFKNYYEQDINRKGNPGYNLIIKKTGGTFFQQGGQLSPEEFAKRKAAYEKLTGRKLEQPKTIKPSEKARQATLDKYNQQPVVQQQPSETIQQSTGLPIEEVTRRAQSQQIREQEEKKAKAAYLDRAAENYMKYHNDTYGSDYGFKTKEQALQEVSQSDFGGLEKYYNMYNPGPKNEELSAYEEQGMASRTWDVITNPFTAFKYSVQTGDFRNMPQYINEARMAGYDVDPDNLVGNAINTFANPFDVTDKVVRNTAAGDYKQAMLEGLRMAPIPLAKYVPTVLRGANKFLSYAPIKQLPWLTGHGALNTHFAYETFKPEGFLDKSYQGFKEEDYGKGVENALWGTLGIAPFIRPGMQTVKALRTPGSMSIIPGAGKYSFAYKSPMESGLLVGNPNLGEAAPAFEKIVNPLSRFTKEAGLGEFKILKQNQAVSNVKPNALLGDMTRAGQAVEVTTPALMENLPQQFRGSPNAISPIDDIGRGLRNEKDPFLKTSGMSDYTDDVAVFSKNDNELAANIIDDIKNRKLELWKTPEGKRRLQKMIDNTPALKGETPESLSEAMEQVTNVNRTYSDKLKALDDIDSKKRQIEIAYAEGYLSVADYKIEINELDQKERILISNLKDIEIALKQYSGAFDLNTRTFEQGVRIQPGAFPLKELPLVTSHELAHFLSSFKKVTPTYIDKQLEGLQLITDFSKQIKIPFAKTTPEKSSAYTVLKADKDDYLKEAVNYWNKGSKGTEKTSFLAEVREDMLQKGIIKSEHQPITNRMLKTHYENYKKAGDSKFPLRVYDIMQNKSENFNLLEKVINNLPVIIGGALAADSFMDENNSDLSEASVSALFAFLLKKPATSKFSKDLKSAFNFFKKGGLDALKPNHIKALKNEIKSIVDQIGRKSFTPYLDDIGSSLNPRTVANTPRQLPSSPNVISSVDDVVFVPRSQSTYKFPTSRIKTESDVIHPANLAFEPENIINKEVHTFLKKNNVDVKGLPESYLWAKNGTDYVLPEGVNHDILNEYARLHHTRDKTLEFKKVAEALEKLNPGIKISSSHDLHAVASNIPYSKWWGSKATSSADDVGRGLESGNVNLRLWNIFNKKKPEPFLPPSLNAEAELARANADALAFSQSPYNKVKLREFRPNQDFNVTNTEALFHNDPLAREKFSKLMKDAPHFLNYRNTENWQGAAEGNYGARNFGDMDDLAIVNKHKPQSKIYDAAIHETGHSRSVRLPATKEERAILDDAWQGLKDADGSSLPVLEAEAVQGELRMLLGDKLGKRVYTKADEAEIKTALEKMIADNHPYMQNINDFDISKIIKSLNKIGLASVVGIGALGAASQFQQGGSFQSGVHTRIPSDVITTKGMSTPLLGVGNFGNQQMMYPGANYTFPGADYVDEYPMMQKGGQRSTLYVDLEELEQNTYALGGVHGDPPPIYVTNPNDPRLVAYQDSLGKYNNAQHNIQIANNYPTLTRTGIKPTLQEKRDLEGNISYNNKGRVNNPVDYVVYQGKPSITTHSSGYTLTRENNFFTHPNLKNIYGNPSGISTPTLYDRDQKLFKKGDMTTHFALPVYQKPKQPVVFKPDPEIVAKQQQLINAGFNIGKADGIWGPKSEAAWVEFQKTQTTEPEATPEIVPEEISSTEESVQQPVQTNQPQVTPAPQIPSGYNVWTDNLGQPLDPQIYGYAPSNNPRQISQHADTYALKRANEAYNKLGATPWATTGNKLVTDLYKPYFSKQAATNAIEQTAQQLGVETSQLQVVKAPAGYSGYVIIQTLPQQRYGGIFQSGGATDWKSRIASTLKLQQGGTPSEIWKQHTGTSWSEAKRQGLTDGSAAQNIALANRVLAGEFGESQVSYEDYQNSRAAYDKMVVDKVMRGATLDDLVTQRVGTRSGLINRFPDLFNQQSPQQPKTLPDKPSAKKETTKRNSPVSVKETPVITPPVVKPQQQAPININELREKIKDLKRKNSMAGPTAMLRQYMKDPLKYAKELEALKNFNQVPKQSLHPSLYVDQSTFTPPGAMLPKVSAEVPSLSRRKEQQPIPGGIASKFSNTSTPGFINQDLLRFTEEKRQRDKEEAKGRIPYKEPSFVDGIFKAAGQTYTGGLDIEKGVDEMGVVMNEMGVVIDDYTRNFNSYFDRFLVKEGYKKPDSHVVQAKPTDKIKEVKPEVKNFYEQIEVTGDKHQKALPGSQLLSYRSQWDANKGFTFYNTEPKNKQRDVNKTYTDVEGVGHFILDASPLDGKTYMHPNNFAFINRAVESDNYIPMFESIPNSDGQVIMKYKKPSEMTEEELKALSIFNEYAERAAKAKNKSEKDQIAKEYAEAINYDKVKIVAPLRQYNFDDVDFNSSVKAPNFKQAKYLKTKDGKLTNLLFTDPAKNKYGRFDGVTVSFIFKDSYGNNIVRDFSGTINDIQKEGADIKTKYGLKDNELVIGYHDVGSFSAKPAAVNGKLSVNFFDGYNNDYGTGSALIIPKQK